MHVGDKYIGYRFGDRQTYGRVITITVITKVMVLFDFEDGTSHWAFHDAFPRYFQSLKKHGKESN